MTRHRPRLSLWPLRADRLPTRLSVILWLLFGLLTLLGFVALFLEATGVL
jgi:hypothetical protein